MGLDVELEHGKRSPSTNVTQDDEVLTGKIALAHLNEFPDYYTRYLIATNCTGLNYYLLILMGSIMPPQQSQIFSV